RNALIETKPALQNVVRQVCTALRPATMVVADLGCSVGANTLLFVSEVISTVADAQCDNSELGRLPMELQFFLNDLPGNDFNQVFQYTNEWIAQVVIPMDRSSSVLYLRATKFFPRRSVHLFHSSYNQSVVILFIVTQLIKDMDEWMADQNGVNIYIAKSSPPSVVKLYQNQFQKDMLLFLELRYQELVPGGQMLLTFLGRKTDDVFYEDLSLLHALLAQALLSLVSEGLVEKGKLESFNIPVYWPSIDEVKAVVARSELFDVGHIKLFESSWDPYNELESDHGMGNSLQSATNIAKSVRAVTESLLACHFGDHILDVLFERYLRIVHQTLLVRGVGNYSVIVMSLNQR
ncbi:hypothetical protein ABZP36_011049, partial [Zizania latifolia]